jgi:hypothetical protein
MKLNLRRKGMLFASTRSSKPLEKPTPTMISQTVVP